MMDTAENKSGMPTLANLQTDLAVKMHYMPEQDKTKMPPQVAAAMIIAQTGGDYLLTKELLERNPDQISSEAIPHATKAAALLKLAGREELAKKITGMVADTLQGKQVSPTEPDKTDSKWQSTVGLAAERSGAKATSPRVGGT